MDGDGNQTGRRSLVASGGPRDSRERSDGPGRVTPFVGGRAIQCQPMTCCGSAGARSSAVVLLVQSVAEVVGAATGALAN